VVPAPSDKRQQIAEKSMRTFIKAQVRDLEQVSDFRARGFARFLVGWKFSSPLRQRLFLRD
jgi:hypothetical protein